MKRSYRPLAQPSANRKISAFKTTKDMDMWTEWVKAQHTCSLRPQCRWLRAASPRRSSWQTVRDRWLSPVTQDFSPLPGFDPGHTAGNTNTERHYPDTLRFSPFATTRTQCSVKQKRQNDQINSFLFINLHSDFSLNDQTFGKSIVPSWMNAIQKEMWLNGRVIIYLIDCSSAFVNFTIWE